MIPLPKVVTCEARCPVVSEYPAAEISALKMISILARFMERQIGMVARNLYFINSLIERDSDLYLLVSLTTEHTKEFARSNLPSSDLIIHHSNPGPRSSLTAQITEPAQSTITANAAVLQFEIMHLTWMPSNNQRHIPLSPSNLSLATHQTSLPRSPLYQASRAFKSPTSLMDLGPFLGNSLCLNSDMHHEMVYT